MNKQRQTLMYKTLCLHMQQNMYKIIIDINEQNTHLQQYRKVMKVIAAKI